jgi:cytochrome c5
MSGRHLALLTQIGAVLLAAVLLADCRHEREVRPPGDMDPALSAAIEVAERRALEELPGGPGRALVARDCLVCHSAALITQQRKDSAGWVKTLAQMQAWGSQVHGADSSTLVVYLRAHFAPNGPSGQPASHQPEH